MKLHLSIVTCTLLTLGACSTTRTLQSASGDPAATGVVAHGLFEPGRISATLGGKTYRGETSYPHRRHLGGVQQTLVADDGSTVRCRWQTHSNPAQGVCSADGRDFSLTLQ